MWTSLTLTALAALTVLPDVQALGQKSCLILSPERDGRHHNHHDHKHRLDDRAEAQVVFGSVELASDILEALQQLNDGLKGHDQLIISSSHHKHALPLLLSSQSAPAVHLAAESFAEDIRKVTGVKPKLYNDTLPRHVKEAIVVGVVGEAGFGGEGDEKLKYVDELKGQWESFDVRAVEGVKGLKRALVVAGSNKRGAVYGLYDISEQLGISPWYFWDDVHVPQRDTIAFDTTQVCAHGEPTVKYRGVFINDELPVLWNWARDTYNISYPESPIQVGLYERIFESTLRMKGNFMWPAMWESMFAADGLNPQKNGLPSTPTPGPNQILADRMGILMGTSHHEPMARTKPEWDLAGSGDWDYRGNKDNLTKWWEYGAERAKGLDTIYTMGMRGDGDRPLTGASVELLEEIAAEQRRILSKVYKTDHVEDVPQAWAMYKEVQGYYMQGLEVPDDVTTLFADDNWGNIRALLPFNHTRKGGGGIYYHADYVGVPTQYKWINTINLAKTWEQMQLAIAYRTTNIWIINLGDIKHHELPTEHFMHLAYDFDAWPRNSVLRYLELWAAREFGEEHAGKVGRLMAEYSQAVDRLKPELLTADSYSNLNYEEAERVEALWDDLSSRGKKLLHALPRSRRDAFFEVVYAPIALVTQMNRMFIAGGKNVQHAYQGRTSANRYAERAIAALKEDWRLSAQYEGMLDGKWKHMLSQPHTNAFWPLHNVRDSTPPLMFIQEQQPATPRSDGTEPGRLMHVRYTHENSRGALPGPNYYNCAQHYECNLAQFNPSLLRMDPYGAQSRWIDVASGGPSNVSWKATKGADWLVVKPDHGSIKGDGTADNRVYVSVDWSKVPNAGAAGEEAVHYDNATIMFSATDGSNATFNVPIAKPLAPPSDFAGHVQGDGYVAIEAAHWTSRKAVDGYDWEEVEWYGKTLSGIEVYPTTDVNFTATAGPSVSYDIWATAYPKHLKEVQVTVQLGPTFNFVLGKELQFAVAFDGDVRTVSPIPEYLPGGETVPLDWDTVVRNDIRNVTLTFELKDAEKSGKHTIELFGMTPGLIVERVLVDMGGIKERGYSYFGPPESTRL